MDQIHHKPSKAHIFLTIIVVLAVGYGVVRYLGPRNTTPETQPTQTSTMDWPSTEVRKESIDDSSKGYRATITYPVTRDTSINKTIKSFIDEQVGTFEEDTAWIHDSDISSEAKNYISIDIQYTQSRSITVETYVFGIATYTGGAHPLSVSKTFAYDKTGTAVSLKDLFTNETIGLARVSSYVQDELTKMKISDAEWIADGAGPTEDNYRSFIVTDTGVTFIFDPYQVAPYVQGAVRIDVPVSVFASVANKSLFTQ